MTTQSTNGWAITDKPDLQDNQTPHFEALPSQKCALPLLSWCCITVVIVVSYCFAEACFHFIQLLLTVMVTVHHTISQLALTFAVLSCEPVARSLSFGDTDGVYVLQNTRKNNNHLFISTSIVAGMVKSWGNKLPKVTRNYKLCAGLRSILTVFHSFKVPRHVYYYALLLPDESKEQWTYFVMCHLCEPNRHLRWWVLPYSKKMISVNFYNLFIIN